MNSCVKRVHIHVWRVFQIVLSFNGTVDIWMKFQSTPVVGYMNFECQHLHHEYNYRHLQFSCKNHECVLSEWREEDCLHLGTCNLAIWFFNTFIFRFQANHAVDGALLLDNPYIVSWRKNYINKIRYYRRMGYYIVYLDESYVSIIPYDDSTLSDLFY